MQSAYPNQKGSSQDKTLPLPGDQDRLGRTGQQDLDGQKDGETSHSAWHESQSYDNI